MDGIAIYVLQQIVSINQSLSSMDLKIPSNISYILYKVPVFVVMATLLLMWGYYIVLSLVAYVTYILLKNVITVFLEKRPFPKRRLILIIVLDLWTHMCKLSKVFYLDIYYTRAYLNSLGYFKSCPYTNIETQISENGTMIYIYKPKVKLNKICMLYIHGGGWCYFSAFAYNPTLSWMAHYLEMTICSVEYKLAPEHPFPEPLLDCYNALQWIYDNQEDLGIDEDKIFVAGDSAGGNLAAALCLLHSDRKGASSAGRATHPPILGQVLLYPSLQAFTVQTSSMLQNHMYFPPPQELLGVLSLYAFGMPSKYISGIPDGSFKPRFWEAATGGDHIGSVTVRSLESYNHDNADTVLSNGLLFPLHDSDLSDMPPAYVLVGTFDTLKDDGVFYAKYLETFNVPVTLMEANDAHGFMMNYQINKPARNELIKIKNFINETLLSNQ